VHVLGSGLGLLTQQIRAKVERPVDYQVGVSIPC